MSRIIITKGVKQYRQTIPFYVNKEDTVVEIGCAWGTTSQLLYQYAGYVVAIDKGASLPAAKKTYPHIRFESIDGFDIGRIKGLNLSFTKVYIDISGCREITDIVKIVRIYATVFSPEIIVVKSSKLKYFVEQCEVWNGLKDLATCKF
jgi:hypothetical protein